MPEFLLLLYDSPTAAPDLSPGDIERIIRSYSLWRDGLEEAGRFAGSQKLCDDGGRVLIPSDQGARVLDGPYAETKEVVGGYFLIRAADYDEAVEIARDCPHLSYGGRIEVREIHLAHEAATE